MTWWVAQTRMLGKGGQPDSDWVVWNDGPTARFAADRLKSVMISSGFRESEMRAHLQDLVDGHTLTADNGRQFRVGPRDSEPVKDPLLDLLNQEPQDGMQRVHTPRQRELFVAATQMMAALEAVPDTVVHHLLADARQAVRRLRDKLHTIDMGD